MLILGIETSCDETAAAVVSDGPQAGRLRANIVLSQLDEHDPYRGVVPEIAARSHLQHLDHLIAQAMDEAGAGWADLDGIAATAGPGLIGGVIVGATMAKALALAHGKPFLAVNHLEGHALTARLTADDTAPVAFPYLLLLVSGGHCELLAVAGVGDYRAYGATIDDAVGEAFDKSAKLMGLGYPGGPALERYAELGNPQAIKLPRPLTRRPGSDFSFAGLKTAVRHVIETWPDGAQPEQRIADLAASFQLAVADVLADRSANAMARFREDFPVTANRRPAFVVAGGVAANKALRARLRALAEAEGFRFEAPPLSLCTDNAAMIAWAGLERLKQGWQDPLDFKPRPRWPLAEMRPPAEIPQSTDIGNPSPLSHHSEPASPSHLPASPS